MNKKTQLLIIITIALAPIIIQNLLPLDNSTFRAWEATTRAIILSDKPFYSNMNLQRIEEGDLGHHTQYAIKKNITWKTDKYGYRGETNTQDQYDIIIIGDSNVVSPGVTQEEMLHNLLENKTGHSTYSLAPSTINTFIKTKRFVKNNPQIIILLASERTLDTLPKINESISVEGYYPIKEYLLDRLDQGVKLNYIRKIFLEGERREFQKHLLISEDKGLIFFDVSLTKQRANEEKINRTIKTMREYDGYLGEREIKLIFIPIPNRETVYYGKIPLEVSQNYPQSNFTAKITQKLNEMNITSIDLLPAFQNSEELTYHRDDTHWNSEGIRITAELIVSTMNLSEIKPRLQENNTLLPDATKELLMYEAIFLLFILAFALRIREKTKNHLSG